MECEKEALLRVKGRGRGKDIAMKVSHLSPWSEPPLSMIFPGMIFGARLRASDELVVVPNPLTRRGFLQTLLREL